MAKNRTVRTQSRRTEEIRPGDRYDRLRDLPRLIALYPQELCDFSNDGTSAIVSRLQLALRTERRRGQAGHWTYDLERHLQLVRAYKAESARSRMVSDDRKAMTGNALTRSCKSAI